MPNLVTLAQTVSELEGKRRKCKSAPEVHSLLYDFELEAISFV